MSKYIIKNCPASAIGWSTNYECLNNGLDCEEVTNCLLKQIVEKSKVVTQNYMKHSQSKVIFAEEILAMLEIQECE